MKKTNKSSEFFSNILKDTRSSFDALSEAIKLTRAKDLSGDLKAICFDGIIKRFEILFTKTINLLRFALSQEGIDTISPRQTMQEAGRLSWIKDLDFWLVAMDTKVSTINKTSDLTHSEYMNIVSQYTTEAEVIINLLTELKNPKEKK